MSDIKNEAFKLFEEKLDEQMMKLYGVPINRAVGEDQQKQAILRACFEMFYDFHDSEEGQDYLFNGGNSVTMIYKTVARHDQLYKFVGPRPLNPHELVPPQYLQTLEKDADACQGEGCATQQRTLWCVEEYELQKYNTQDLCSFCASQLNLSVIDKCLSKSDECKTCPNHDLAKEIAGDEGYIRDRKVVPFK